MAPPHPSRPLLMAALLLFAACGDDDPAGPEVGIDAFVGNWTGISMVFTPAGGGSPFDAILAGGTLNVTVAGSGAFTMRLALPPLIDRTDTGTISVSDGRMTMTTDGVAIPQEGTFQLTQGGSRLTFDATEGVFFDFDQDGVVEPATLRLVLQKS